jgi:hypothetical protein
VVYLLTLKPNYKFSRSYIYFVKASLIDQWRLADLEQFVLIILTASTFVVSGGSKRVVIFHLQLFWLVKQSNCDLFIRDCNKYKVVQRKKLLTQWANLNESNYTHPKLSGVIDWFIHYLLFYVPFKIFSLTWRGHHYVPLKDRCSALRAFQQGGIFIMPHLLWHGTSVFPVSSEGPPHSVAFFNTQGDAEDLF